MEYAANPNANRSALLEVFSNLKQFYPSHIWKEEYLLFPLARKVLSVQEDERLLKEFASVESDIFSTHTKVMSSWRRDSKTGRESLSQDENCRRATCGVTIVHTLIPVTRCR